MEIVTTRRLRFKAGGREFITMGGGNIEAAPDWIVHDSYYHGAKSKGYLTEFNRGPVVKAVELPTDPVAEVPVGEPVYIVVDEKPRRGRRRKEDAGE